MRVLLVFLAACAATPKPATQASSPPQSELGQLVDEMCACSEPECLDAALDRLQPRLEGAGPEAERESARAEVCFEHHVMVFGHRAIVEVARETADRVCACRNVGCAVAAATQGANQRAEIPHVEEDSDEHRAADEVFVAEERRAAACYYALPGAVDPAVGVANVVALADSVCACREEAACIAKAGAAFRAASTNPATVLFLDSHVTHAHIGRALACGWAP